MKAGQKFGPYEVVSTLGKGGMGEVYLARDTRLGRQVALKLLPRAFTQDQERLGRFELEARAVSALNHPNILTIHEVGEIDGQRFIATEFVDGETLRQRFTSPIETTKALHIAEQIASALAEAHSAGIIHRDIKPENIMIRQDGILKVLDFGLAKLTQIKEGSQEDSTRLLVKTSTGSVMGTVAYMSPEQARGLPLDARTDIWSLGVVLYEMLAGSGPFIRANGSDTLVSILEREPRSLNSFSPEIPEALEWIVTKTLTKDFDDRYQTARELLTDLRRLRQQLNTAAELKRITEPGPAEGSATLATFGKLNANVSGGGSKKWTRWAVLLLAVPALLTTLFIWKSASWFKSAAPQVAPVVVLMDSPLPDRVYDPETRKNGGTNADDITDILRDLPIVIEKENTSALWHREDQVLRENPALIVIHRSCFADAATGFDPQSVSAQVADNKLETFLGYISLGNPNTKFLVYTRRAEDHAAWAADLGKRFPKLSGRFLR